MRVVVVFVDFYFYFFGALSPVYVLPVIEVEV